jgi:hypothetical protein|uniref:Uncharacterized protein n=1 Tax=Myoviridae sp. ctshb19 TaxID=2825194 RepID=A0A8S5UH13_9CAUD|nr:MAG TPA: hypothetical protein [Myoviridae sp. ctshb19]
MTDTLQREKIRDAMVRRDILGNSSFKQTHLFTAFAAIRASIKKYFKIKDLPFVHNNDVKQMIRQQYEPTYPYAYVSMTSIAKTEMHLLSPTIRRRGIGYVTDGSNSTLTRLHYFPITLKYEFHYVTNDYFDAVRFIGEALILFDSKVLNVRITTGATSSFLEIKADMPEIQIPRADKENEADPESFDLVISCTSNTWTGIEKKISKVNNAGAVTFHAVVVNPDGAVVDEEITEIETADDV